MFVPASPALPARLAQATRYNLELVRELVTTQQNPKGNRKPALIVELQHAIRRELPQQDVEVPRDAGDLHQLLWPSQQQAVLIRGGGDASKQTDRRRRDAGERSDGANLPKAQIRWAERYRTKCHR